MIEEDDEETLDVEIPEFIFVPPEKPVKVLVEADKLADEIRQGVSEDQISFPNPIPILKSVSQTGFV